MRHYLDPADLTQAETMELIHTANDMLKNPADYARAAAGKIIATLFFEPSTRTRLSFESAMLSLGGSVITVSGTEGSSVAKGESLADTIRVISCYADICALRHPRDGAACAAANASGIPVINAGDGGHFHPTQTLLDMLAIYNTKGTLGGFTIGFCGDLKYGRPVHSLVKALSQYAGVKFVFISSGELKLPQYVKGYVNSGSYTEVESLSECISGLDVLYMTRVQRERMEHPESYERIKDFCVLDAKKMQLARKDLTVLHPLPRLNEITTDVDEDPRAYYFTQAKGGRYIRTALIKFLLERVGGERNNFDAEIIKAQPPGLVCGNGNCITNHERGLKKMFEQTGDGQFKCRYCDKKS